MKPWEVLKAVDEGKTVQYLAPHQTWVIPSLDKWDIGSLPEVEWRIKPEPMIVYFNLYSKSNGPAWFGSKFDSREKALAACRGMTGYIRTVKLVEELE